MIFVTGDTHGVFARLTDNEFNLFKELNATKDDYVIVCGDFGGVWAHEDNERYLFKENKQLDYLEKTVKPTILFVDGNHENHHRLAKFPVEEWNGGKVHVIRPHILHLMRGEVFTIEGKKFFTFGGAQSHDIDDGILDMSKEEDVEKWEERHKNPYKMFRILNVSWWAEELPSGAEMANGLMNLDKHDWKVDYVITHCLPTSDVYHLASMGLVKPEHDKLTDYLEEVRAKLDYTKWYCGHYHQDLVICGKENICYWGVIRLT